MYTFVHLCACLYMCECMCVHMFVHVYVHVCVCIGGQEAFQAKEAGESSSQKHPLPLLGAS